MHIVRKVSIYLIFDLFDICHLFVWQQISSFSKELLRAKQIGTSQTERANYLEDQCTLLRERVDDLSQILAQKEGEEIKDKETVSTAVQTDDASKAC